MRLFIATPVTLLFYKKLQVELSPYITGNWTKPFNLHLTHLFIGEDNPEDYKFNLNIPNEQIKIKGFGFFDKKILYLKAYSPNINSIHKQLLKLTNIKSKPFKPHITLCRIKQVKDIQKVREILNKFENIETKVDYRVILYTSTLTPSGAVYKKIYNYNETTAL